MSNIHLNNFESSKIIAFRSLSSTNNYAIEQVKNGLLLHGDAVFTFDQTAGKGQRGKRWHSAAGQNLALSTAWQSDSLDLQQQFDVIIIGALAAYDLFASHCGEEDTRIKWPNDIYWKDRKAGGILTETVVRQQIWQWTIIGIGININQTTFDNTMNRKPVSMRQITGKEWDCLALANKLWAAQQRRWSQYCAEGVAVLLAEYNHILYRKEMEISIVYQGVILNAKVLRVEKTGQIFLEIGGNEVAFQHSDFEWLTT